MNVFSWFMLLAVLLGVLSGCEDLPDADCPLLPASSENLVSDTGGRGGYDWQLENGAFHVAKPFDSNLLANVDREKVAARIPQLLTMRDNLPDFQPPDGLPNDLARAITEYFQPRSHQAGLLLELPLPQGSQPSTLALSASGDRLLVIDAHVTLWDIQAGKQVCQWPSPSTGIKFAFLDRPAEVAFLFDAQKIWKLMLNDGTVTSSELTAGEIALVVHASLEHQFLVASQSNTLIVDENMQTVSSPALPVHSHGQQCLSADGRYFGSIQETKLTVVDLAGSGLQREVTLQPKLNFTSCMPVALNYSDPSTVGQVFRATGRTTSPNYFNHSDSGIVAASGHHLFSTHKSSAVSSGTTEKIVLPPTASSGYRIDNAFAASDAAEKWMVVGALSSPDPALSEYCLIDVDLVQEKAYRPTFVGKSRPAKLVLSDDARVFATVDDGAIRVRKRERREIKSQHASQLVNTLIKAIEHGHAEQAEQVLNSLRIYAETNPCTQTRELLNLASPVIKGLAVRHLRLPNDSADAAPPAINQSLQDWVERKSTLANVFEAFRTADLRFVGSSQSKWISNNSDALVRCHEILQDPNAPLAAFELLVQLTWLTNGNVEDVDAHYNVQFERDPLNFDLHMLICNFFGAERVGEAGLADAYLNEVCELLSDQHRDLFYTTCGARYLAETSRPRGVNQSLPGQAGMPLPTLSGSSANMPLLQLNNNLPNLLVKRLIAGTEKLVQPESKAWRAELDEAAWASLIWQLGHDGHTELCQQVKQIVAVDEPFAFTPAIQHDTSYIEAVKKKWE